MKNNTVFREMAKTLAAFVCAAMILLSCLGGFGAPAARAEAGSLLDAEDMFSSRDLTQTADLSGATAFALSDGSDLRVTEEGVYVLTGEASNVTVYVDAGSDAKVQLVLDGVTIVNDSLPCVCVLSAGKVFVTTSADSSLSVTGSFQSDGNVKLDGVIFSRADLTLNGTAALTISSTANGVVGKDDVKVTGGSYVITAVSKAVEANDSIRVADGTLTLTAGADGLHAENDDDDSLGYVYIGGGSLTISARDDGIHANSAVQIDGGVMDITAAEGIEGTYVQINGGEIAIKASDDGINAAQKSSAYRAAVEINGGSITIAMGSGDTDGVDSNGDIYVNGGTISVTGSSTFDYDGTAQYNGGVIIANGQQIAYIPNQMMGGGGRGNMNNGWGNMGGGRGGRGW